MSITMQVLRFSGHDTFHCKENWLLNGCQYVESQENASCFRKEEAISDLGVGRNMVRSIQHWLRSFGLINEEGTTNFAKKIFLEEAFDPYLENEGTLWLLQYMICHQEYASIFKLVFSDYFYDKANSEFSETQIMRFLNQRLKENGQKANSINTLSSDFKVFVKSYVAPVKNEKTVEDDFNVPLQSLNLISLVGRQNEYGEEVYQINKINNNPPLPIFVFCLLTEFSTNQTISFEEVRRTLGAYLCISNDNLDSILYELSDVVKEIVYKSDAGIRQIQIGNLNDKFKYDILREYYGI